jgi:hypothetical protein
VSIQTEVVSPESLFKISLLDSQALTANKTKRERAGALTPQRRRRETRQQSCLFKPKGDGL